MSAEVIALTGDDDAAVLAAVSALEKGELVVIPTETVYGLVADPPDGWQARCPRTNPPDPARARIRGRQQLHLRRLEFSFSRERTQRTRKKCPLRIFVFLAFFRG